MTGFDLKAATWDEDPQRRELAAAIAGAMFAVLGLRPGERLLDLGCGTGLVGHALGQVTGDLLGIDVSAAMVARFRAKTADRPGLRAEVRDLLAAPLPPGSVDAAVSAMAFHHLPDPDGMLRALHAATVPGGRLAIADLESEDGSFHGAEKVPWNGFDPAVFTARLTATGWQEPAWRRVHSITKGGRIYPVFLATARRSGSLSRWSDTG